VSLYEATLPRPQIYGTVICNSLCLCVCLFVYGSNSAHRQDEPHVLYIRIIMAVAQFAHVKIFLCPSWIFEKMTKTLFLSIQTTSRLGWFSPCWATGQEWTVYRNSVGLLCVCVPSRFADYHRFYTQHSVVTNRRRLKLILGHKSQLYKHPKRSPHQNCQPNRNMHACVAAVFVHGQLLIERG
jgi:hypothetical protein